MKDSSKRFNIIRIIVFVALVGLGFYFLSPKPKPVSDDSAPTQLELKPGWSVFPGKRFSMQYPSTYKVDKTYQYQALGPGKEISGVSFTIPEDYVTGTNLSSDSRVSLEQVGGAKQCSAQFFVTEGQTVRTIMEHDVSYSYSESIEPAAGNIYEEKVYALIGSVPCTALRYLIHSGNIQNYEPGVVKEFDKKKLLDEFDEIRSTLMMRK